LYPVLFTDLDLVDMWKSEININNSKTKTIALDISDIKYVDDNIYRFGSIDFTVLILTKKEWLKYNVLKHKLDNDSVKKLGETETLERLDVLYHYAMRKF